MPQRILQRYDLAANWAQANPILGKGESGYESDTEQYKVGDGVSTWSQLPYRGLPAVQQTGSSKIQVMSQESVTLELAKRDDKIVQLEQESNIAIIKTIRGVVNSAIYNYSFCNIYDKSTDIIGELNGRSGSTPVGIQVNANYSRSAYIPVKPDTTYKYQCDNKGNAWAINLTFYDETLTPISGGFVQFTDSKGEASAISPSNAFCASFNTMINQVSLANIKFCEGVSDRSEYTEYLKGINLINTEIITAIESKTGATGISVYRQILNSVDYLYIRSYYDKDYDVVHKCEVRSHYGNDNFNFNKTYLTLKANSITTENVILKVSPDDVAPVELYGRTFIGGNHGIDNYITARIPAHGKTNANYGDEYLDSTGRKFYLINIIDNNTLGFLSENIGISDVLFSFGQATGSLTRGVEVIPSSALTQMQQLRPSTKLRSKKVFLDGNTVAYNTLCKGNELVIYDEYDCLWASRVLNYCIANKVNWSNAISKVDDAYITFRNNYSFTKFGITGVNGCFVAQNVGKARYGAISFDPLNVSSGQTLKLQIPKTKMFAHGGKSYNFTNMQDWNTNFVNDGWMYLNQSFWETSKMPDRWSEFICENDIPKHVSTTGFIQIGDGSNEIRKANSNDSIAINGYRKVYGRVFDQKVTFDDLNAKRNFEIAWYRNFQPTGTNNIISKSVYKFGDKYYMNIDYQASFEGIDTLSIDEKLANRKIIILEKSDNVDILSGFASMNGLKTRKNDRAYGYCTIVFE